MIAVICAVILLGGALSLRRNSDGKQALFFKAILVVLYLAIAIIAANTYQAGLVADQTGASGSAVGWFGDWWLPLLLILVLFALFLQAVLFFKRRDK